MDITLLDSAFQPLVIGLMNNCADIGLVIRPVSGLRTPLQQAKIWRQGRSSDAIANQILQLKNCPYLAACITSAGPQNGPWATNALPGMSWHNWGMAVDFLCYDNIGNPINDGSDPAYAQLQKVITKSGLYGYGVNWKVDAGHTQMYAGSPSQMHSMQEIDEILKQKYPLSQPQ